MPRSTLIFGWGNPSRGDDALGPMFVERIQSVALIHPEWGNMDFQTDFQLQVEHALDLRGHSRVLFVDASATCPAPFSLLPLIPAKDASFTTHSMTPQAVLHTYYELEADLPPPAWLLAIRGERFELGETISSSAEQYLQAALIWVENWLKTGK
ncbi:MAG: hydrogenase maturation protease [Proteobacteria bacterium]|nr:hydrogenase maturation protease [Pseudomonadota bacterium]